jgi:hypothetical protein
MGESDAQQRSGVSITEKEYLIVPPLLLAVAHDLEILRVDRHLLPVIIAAAPTLALRADCTRFVEDDKRRVETNFGSKDSGGTGSSRLLRNHWDESVRRIENTRSTQANRENQFRNCCRVLTVDRGLSRVDHWLRPKPAKMAPLSPALTLIGVIVDEVPPGLTTAGSRSVKNRQATPKASTPSAENGTLKTTVLCGFSCSRQPAGYRKRHPEVSPATDPY